MQEQMRVRLWGDRAQMHVLGVGLAVSETPLLCLKCCSTFTPGCHRVCLAHVSTVGRKAAMLLGGIVSKIV